MRAMVRAASGPIPSFGSAAWHRLPEGSRERVAAVCVAAQAWAEQSDHLAVRLHRELADARAANDQHDAAEFARMAAGVRRLASVPTMAEVWDRRGQPERAERSRRRAVETRDGWNAPGGAA